MNKNPANPASGSHPQKILVVVTRRIGDVLLATPLFRSLKRAWPAARIDALVFTGTQGVLMGNPDLDRVLTMAGHAGLAADIAVLARLFRRYDLALSLVPSDRSTLCAWLAGRHSIGLLVDEPHQAWKKKLLDQWAPFDAVNTHTVRAHLALAVALGVTPLPDVVTAWLPGDAAAVDALLGQPYAPFVVLHPSPKFRYKMWREDGWIAVARWCIDNGFRVVLSGSPDAEERAYVDGIARGIPGALNLAGRLTLGGSAAMLARAQCYVGPDTSITHMAAASGVPTIALLGPSDPVKWGPWPQKQPAAANPWRRLGNQRRGNVLLIQGRAACVPCKYEGCGRHLESASDCLLSLPAQDVIDGIKTMLFQK
jgi:heptosyltransferase III